MADPLLLMVAGVVAVACQADGFQSLFRGALPSVVPVVAVLLLASNSIASAAVAAWLCLLCFWLAGGGRDLPNLMLELVV